MVCMTGFVVEVLLVVLCICMYTYTYTQTSSDNPGKNKSRQTRGFDTHSTWFCDEKCFMMTLVFTIKTVSFTLFAPSPVPLP